MSVRALELFSGIGGWHFGLEMLAGEAGDSVARDVEVCLAMDVNDSAMKVYSHNFPGTLTSTRSVESLTVTKLDTLAPHLWLMSPPCQPFTRNGLQLDLADKRTDGLKHLLSLLPRLQRPPRCIVMENVAGFEKSEAHGVLCSSLKSCGYRLLEYLLTPSQLGVPNSRLRYYLVAVREEFLRLGVSPESLSDAGVQMSLPHTTAPPSPVVSVSHFLEVSASSEEKLLLQKKHLRLLQAMDIIGEDSLGSCCFTSSYGSYLKGTGSVLQMNGAAASRDDAIPPEDLRLRFFSPREVANLMGFPSHLSWPETTSHRSLYHLLGNSLSISVVTEILRLALTVTELRD